MKKSMKIALSTVTCLAVVAGGVTMWQWDNIQALRTAGKYTQEELAQQRQENQDQLKETIASTPGVTIRDLTEEEKAALKEGTMSREEIIANLIKPAAPETPAETTPAAPADPQPAESKPTDPKPTEPAPQPQTPVAPPAASAPGVTPPAQPPEQPVTPPASSQQPSAPGEGGAAAPEEKPDVPPQPEKPAEPEQPEEPDRVSELLAEVIVMQQEFESSLESIKDGAASSYSSDMTAKEKAQLALGCMSDAYALEDECDAKMNAIVKELESYSPDIAKEVQATYKAEKTTTKAEYMAEIKQYANI